MFNDIYTDCVYLITMHKLYRFYQWGDSLYIPYLFMHYTHTISRLVGGNVSPSPSGSAAECNIDYIMMTIYHNFIY